MGIKGLKGLITDNYPKSNRIHQLNIFKGKTLCIDSSLMLHRSLHKNMSNDISSIYKYFITVILKLFTYNIMPVFVFDGKPPEEKNKILLRRRLKRKEALKKVETLNKLKQQISKADDIHDVSDIVTNLSNSTEGEHSSDSETSNNDFDYITSVLSDSINSNNSVEDIEETLNANINKETKKSVSIKEKYIIALKELFDQLNISYIHIIDEEADIVCKFLVSQNYVDGCISDDMDLIAYGCPLVIQNLNFTNNIVDVFEFDKLLDCLNIREKQMIDLCICCGNEANNKLINIKCEDICKLINSYGTIEAIIENINDINTQRKNQHKKETEYKTVKIPYDFNYENSRKYFTRQLDDLGQNLKNYYDDSHNPYIFESRFIFDTVDKSNINQFEKIVYWINTKIEDWPRGYIRNKISKIIYKNYNKTKYYELHTLEIPIKYEVPIEEYICREQDKLFKSTSFRFAKKKKKRKSKRHLDLPDGKEIYNDNPNIINTFNIFNSLIVDC